MQAAGLRLGHIGDRDAVNALGDVDGVDVHGIKGSDNAEAAVFGGVR